MIEGRCAMEHCSSLFGGGTNSTWITRGTGRSAPLSSIPCTGRPYPRSNKASAARTATLSFLECIKATSRSMALAPWSRARSRISAETFGRPPGFPLWPGFHAEDGAFRPVSFRLFSVLIITAPITGHDHIPRCRLSTSRTPAYLPTVSFKASWMICRNGTCRYTARLHRSLNRALSTHRSRREQPWARRLSRCFRTRSLAFTLPPLWRSRRAVGRNR